MPKLTSGIVFKLAALLFICFCFLNIVKLQFENNELRGDINDISGRIINAENELEDLTRRVEQPFDSNYVEGVAREELDYRDPGEIVFYNDN